MAQLADATAVRAVRPDRVHMKVQHWRGRHTGVVIFGEHEANTAARIEVRAFAPACGIGEDPVCGSGNGGGAVIRHTGQLPHFGHDFPASQGRVLQRDGIVRLIVDGETIRIGGTALTCIDGRINAVTPQADP